MTEPKPPLTRVSDLLDDVAMLNLERFREKHGEVFLLQETTEESLRTPANFGSTVVSEDLAPLVARGGWLREYLVYPVRRSGRTAFSDYITVGRTQNNDIVIPDASISKFHAVFREEGGGLAVHDAGSKNGTVLNGQSVPGFRDGDPLLVKTGDRLKFGHVLLTFLGVDELVTLVQHAATLNPPR